MNNQINLKQTFQNPQASSVCGFAMAPADIQTMASISYALLTGTLHYQQAEQQIKAIVGNAFVYREGNKRIVIVSQNQRFVIKIAKLAGYEGIRDNMNEQASCVFMNTQSKYRSMKYAPEILAVYGTDEFPALVLVQEKHKEILEDIARQLGMRVSEKELIEHYIRTVCGIGYITVKKMLDSISEECFISDLPLIRSAANLSMNSLGSFAVLDWGSALPKNGFEARCPKCGAPMAYHVEEQSAFTTSLKYADMNTIKPVYRCIANDAHEIDPDVFFSRLTAGDQTVIMSKQDAINYIAQMQQQKAQISNTQDMATAQTFPYNGINYYVGSATHNSNGAIYRRLFMLNSQPTNMYVNTATSQVVQS